VEPVDLFSDNNDSSNYKSDAKLSTENTFRTRSTTHGWAYDVIV